MASAATLKKRINELLESADLNTISERKLKDSLAQEFGEEEIKKHTRVIRNTVKKFLETAGAGDEDSEGDDDEADEGGSTKRKADSQSQPDAKRTKVDGNSYILALNDGMKKLAVRTFKGKVLIDFREYYKDKNTGEDKPGKKGLSLQREQWMALKAALPQLAAAFEAGNTDMPHVQLGSMRRAYVSEYNGKTGVHIREFYTTADGEQKPSPKGLTLDSQAMATLRQHEQEIEAHTERLGGPAPLATQASAVGGAGPSSAAAGSPAAKQAAPPPAGAGGASTSAAAGPSASGASPAGAAPAAAEGGQGEGRAGEVELGNDRRCTVKVFKGSKQVDLREWYRKDGELKPGMKGISLQVSDWNTICSAVADIDRAVQQHDMNYNLYLSGKRKVSLSQFKGKTYVAVREFYLKDNQEMPGQKGLNMTPEQWDTLKKGIPNISAAV